MTEDNHLFVILQKEKGRVTGHSFSRQKPTSEALKRLNEQPAGTPKKPASYNDNSVDELSFRNIIKSFSSIMDTYRNMIATTIELSPVISSAMANTRLGDYVKENGNLLDELEADDFSVYKVSENYIPTIVSRHKATISAMKGVEHLPEVAIIGLISVYDAYLAKLLRLILATHDHFIFSSDREIKFSDLTKFSSIEDAKSSIIDNEVELVLRKSHHEHFKWMENKFELSLTKNLAVWPDFIELCERRNLLTHTGGRVSKQYINNCANHKHITDKNPGDMLETGPDYFKNSVRIISEIGLKLGHVLWRKLIPSEFENVENHLNHTAYNLIVSKEYQVAERLLSLGVKLPGKIKEITRRQMIINLANCQRLQNDQAKAKKTLGEEDWSAASPNLQICHQSVLGDVEAVCALMRSYGSNSDITPQNYQDWPVFIHTRDKPEFQKTYQEIYGKPFSFQNRNITEIENEADETPCISADVAMSTDAKQ